MSKTLSATRKRAPIAVCSGAMSGECTGVRERSGTPKSSGQAPGHGRATRQRLTRVRAIDSVERSSPGASELSPGVTELATGPTGVDTANQASLRHGAVLAFNSVDERFIDFLVEEALNEWRAKNF